MASEPARAADRLLETVLSRGAPDNVSMIIVRMT
jgi:serine/threonine protein phosphatase PrpC